MSMFYSGRYGKLPLFPALYGEITEERIERMVERMFNVGDAIFTNGDATQEQYDAWSDMLGNYANRLYQEHITPFANFPGVNV
jgi:hypothetical protein